MTVKKNEVYYADFSDSIGSEQSGIRPVVILQNDIGNRYSPTTIVAVITSRTKKAILPTHVRIVMESGRLSKKSTAMLEQIKTIDKKRLMDFVGKIDKNTSEAIERAMTVSLGIKNNGG